MKLAQFRPVGRSLGTSEGRESDRAVTVGAEDMVDLGLITCRIESRLRVVH